jgi:hypothetical protein
VAQALATSSVRAGQLMLQAIKVWSNILAPLLYASSKAKKVPMAKT